MLEIFREQIASDGLEIILNITPLLLSECQHLELGSAVFFNSIFEMKESTN